MEEIVKKDLLDVLKKTLEIIGEIHPNSADLKELSNHTIHNISIYQDEHSVALAVLTYSLSKMMDRLQHKISFDKIKNLISLSIEYLEDDNVENYADFIGQIFSIIKKLDSKFQIYVQEVISQAQVKKGGKLYEHGISASKTAEILGISLWDLYNYLGATNIIDEDNNLKSVRERLNYTRSLFQ